MDSLFLNGLELIHLPSLSNSLRILDCCHNRITKLPENLPHSLQILWCNYNKITTLPKNLPRSLQVLNCSHNELAKLPKNLPNSLHELYCSSNRLTVLPKHLPKSLRYIHCYNNQITELPILLLANDCDVMSANNDMLFFNSAIKIIKRIRQKYRWLMHFCQWSVYRICINCGLNDCSFVIVQYL